MQAADESGQFLGVWGTIGLSMSQHGPLYEQLSRGQAGDAAAREEAYAELCRLITIFVRAGMGQRLRDHRESVDVCQSIARSFVEDHGAGKIRFGNDGELIEYLRAVVQTKFARLSRHDNAAKRVPTGDGPSTPPPMMPSDSLEHTESLREVDEQFTDEDREVARLRLGGMSWEQIAAQLGQTPQALRKRWSRLAQRLSDGPG
jgi:hypothetical protein